MYALERVEADAFQPDRNHQFLYAGADAIRRTTELLRNGVPIAEVSRRLGHADQNITLSIYSHAVPADSRAAAKVWNDALGDVIQTSKKPAAARSLAESCTETTKLRVFVGNKRKKLAGTTGFEPATSDVTGRRSNQLNYVPAMSGG